MRRSTAPPAQQLGLFGALTPQVAPLSPAPPGLSPQAAALRPAPPGVRLGTSSWSFPGWAGHLWDRPASEEELARTGLAAYAKHPLLRTVGVDRTHYRPMSAPEFAALAAQVPDDFRFLVKAHEDCTLAVFPQHPRYGRRAGLPNDRFLDPAAAADTVVGPWLDGLKEKAGILLFQFAPQPGIEDRFADRLHAFLSRLPPGPRYAVELRNEALYAPAVADAIHSAGAIPGLTVWGRLPPLRIQARRLQADRSPVRLIRWMLPPGVSYEEQRSRLAPFDRLAEPDPDVREQIVEQIREAEEAWVIVNNKAEGCSVLSVVELAGALG